MIQRPFLSLVLAIATFACCHSFPLGAAELNESQTLDLLVRVISNVKDDSTRASLLRGMLDGLEGRRSIPEPVGWDRLREQLESSENESLRNSANRLSQIFGNEEALQNALRVVKDRRYSPTQQRRAALSSLLAQRYKPLADELPKLLSDPDLQIDAIRGFSTIESADAPALLMRLYRDSDDHTRKAIIETLATRKSYAESLVDAIGEKQISREDIPSYVARSMRDIMGQRFVKAYGKIPELGGNVTSNIAKYKRLITDEALAKADPRRGRTIFKKTCGNCHLMYGDGGKIGPDLTGSNRANLDYFLLNSVAPSADVPEGYRTQLVQTVDGRVLTGVLAEEDNQRIILKTVDQPRLVIAKDDIEARKVSEKSMMPEGQLDQLKHQDLFDLVKYLQTKSQVEAAE